MVRRHPPRPTLTSDHYRALAKAVRFPVIRSRVLSQDITRHDSLGPFVSTHLAHDWRASFRHSGIVIVWRDQAEHAAESLAKGSRVVVVGRLQQRAWTAEDGSARSVVEVLADGLGPSLRWATETTTRRTRSQDR
jgi:hypothetical protein